MKFSVIRFCLCVLLVLSTLVCLILPGAAETVKEEANRVVYKGHVCRRSSDVPSIHIFGSEDTHVSYYIDCAVVAIDRTGGTMETVVDENASIRIRGNSTSAGAKKPYNIKFSSKTNLFGMGKGKRYCLIANMYDPTLLRNHTVFRFAKEIGLPYTPDSMLVDVYYNNQYLGCYQLAEALTDDKDRVDIDCDAGDFLLERDARTDPGKWYFVSDLGIRFGVNEPEEPTDAQKSAILTHVRKAENALLSGNYDEVLKYFDIPSMVDFYICLEFFKNVDIDCASTRFYFQDGKFYGGPVWDFDLSSGNCSSSYYVSYYREGDCARGFWANALWYRQLLKYDAFSEAVHTRYLELQDRINNLYRDNVLGKSFVSELRREAIISVMRNFSVAPWRPDRVYSELMRIPEQTYEQNLDVFTDWMRRRNAWLLSVWELNDRVYPKPKDESLKIHGDYLLGVAPETPAYSLSSLFTTPVVGTADGEYLTTGSTVRGEGASLIVVVDGDLDGDGTQTVVDYMRFRRAQLTGNALEGAEYYAACRGSDAPDQSLLDDIRAKYQN